ncbi:MAG TPA: NADH-quinone oxidoreductase subunit J [Gemmataceae bacterium]|nr:NADH-quinone oxidoreductase subunit J [Gemmataceae bacterium]
MPPALFSAAPPLPGPTWWGIVLPLLLGAAAIFLLLPRPRAFPVLWGALLGIAALLVAGFTLVRAGVLAEETAPEAVLFYAFSAIAIVSGTLLVTQRNPARAAMSFALVVLSTCGLFLLLAAPFLMAATIVVYAGAIIVTFLFVIMLAQQEGPSDADARSREPLLSVATGFVLLGALLYVLQLTYGTDDIDRLLERTRQAAAHDDTREITAAVGNAGTAESLFKGYKAFANAHGWPDLLQQVNAHEAKWASDESAAAMKETLAALAATGEEARTRLGSLRPPGGLGGAAESPHPALSNLSGPPPTVPPGELRRDATGRPQLPAENSAYLGRSLFTDYLLPVELGGTLLLVAAVGAIAIAQRRGGERTTTGTEARS